MQYRQFPTLDLAVSVMTLSLEFSSDRVRADQVRDLVHTALGNGINSLEIATPHPAVLSGVADASGLVERNLLCISLRIVASRLPDITPQSVLTSIRTAIVQTGIKYLDLVTLESPQAPISKPVLEILWKLRKAGHIRALGIHTSSQEAERYLETGLFHSIHTSQNLFTPDKERARTLRMFERGLAVFACDAFTQDIAALATPGLAQKSGLFKRKPAAWEARSPFDFLFDTGGWRADELCIGYNLTNPSIASVAVQTDRPETLDRLSESADRNVPQALGAQFEMARIAIANPREQQSA